MNDEDPWAVPGPSDAALEELEHIDEHRRAFLALKPADEDQARVRKRILEALDDLEESLCEGGPDTPAQEEGWQLIDELQVSLWKGSPPAREAEVVSIDRRRRGARPAPTTAPRPAAA